MNKAEGMKLQRPREVMEWFWTTQHSRALPFALDEEDESARIEPCRNAVVQLETGQYVGLQYAYERNAMALIVSEGENAAVIDHVLQELRIDVARIVRAEDPVWEARSLMRRAWLAAERGDGVTAMAFMDQALPMLHRVKGSPDFEALLAAAETMERLGAHERAAIIARSAIEHARKAGDSEAIGRGTTLLDTIAERERDAAGEA